jgi:hypothetical protein
MASVLMNAPISHFETYVQSARRVVDYLGPKGTKRYIKDEHALAEHAATLRSIGAQLIFIEGGCVPALKIHAESPSIRLAAAEAVGYVESQLKMLAYQLEQPEVAAA